MDSASVKKKVGDNKALFALVAAFAAIIGIFAILASRAGESLRPAGSTGGSIATPGIDKPSGTDFTNPPNVTPFDFGWVDGNDKGLLQKMELSVKYVDASGKIIYVREQQLTYKAGMEQEFFVTGKLLDAATGKGLDGWGYAANIFDANHNSINSWQGKTAWAGFLNFSFKLKPAQAGVYRVRVAAGDAANEEAIVFNLPQNTPPIQNNLYSSLR